MAVIKLSLAQWAKIHNDLAKNNVAATMLIREVMKRELGFTVRRHREWSAEEGYGQYDGLGEWVEEIHLDFIDSEKELLFRLKYL